jgi:pimeloyl-ACP methyl ester carboxylesterase
VLVLEASRYQLDSRASLLDDEPVKQVFQRLFKFRAAWSVDSCWRQRTIIAGQSTCNRVTLPTMNQPNPPTPPAGETLPVQTFGNGAGLVVAVHGITASAMTWPPLARQLSAEWTLVAPDLRGRGAAAELPGPYGLRRHVEDICALVRSRQATSAAVMALAELGQSCSPKFPAWWRWSG